MNNKLKIALKCTRYLLVAVLVVLPFVGSEQTEAKAQAAYTHEVVDREDCPSGSASICYAMPGGCPSGNAACLVQGWDG